MKSARYPIAASFLLALTALNIAAGEVRGSRSTSQPCDKNARRFTFSEAHMGTIFRIVLYAPDATTAEKASRDAFDRVAKLDNALSDYKPESELMRLCQEAGGPPAKVSADLFQVLAAAQKLA